jgi:hypothetical protein
MRYRYCRGSTPIFHNGILNELGFFRNQFGISLFKRELYKIDGSVLKLCKITQQQ